MNVGEAHDVNCVLDYFLGLPGPGGGPVEREAAIRAASRLADRADRTLMCGLNGRKVEAIMRAAGDVAARKGGRR